MDATDFLRHVMDPVRLAVTGRVAARPGTAAEIAGDVGCDTKTTLGSLAPLLAAGIVARDADQRYHLVADRLVDLAAGLSRPPPLDPAVLHGMTAAEGVVLQRFFRGGRLSGLPTQRTKRLVVLERLALEFEPGQRYAESDVNAILGRFHDDYATLRRALVDEGFLDRATGQYWRAGGRVDHPSPAGPTERTDAG